MAQDLETRNNEYRAAVDEFHRKFGARMETIIAATDDEYYKNLGPFWDSQKRAIIAMRRVQSQVNYENPQIFHRDNPRNMSGEVNFEFSGTEQFLNVLKGYFKQLEEKANEIAAAKTSGDESPLTKGQERLIENYGALKELLDIWQEKSYLLNLERFGRNIARERETAKASAEADANAQRRDTRANYIAQALEKINRDKPANGASR